MQSLKWCNNNRLFKMLTFVSLSEWHIFSSLLSFMYYLQPSIPSRKIINYQTQTFSFSLTLNNNLKNHFSNTHSYHHHPCSLFLLIQLVQFQFQPLTHKDRMMKNSSQACFLTILLKLFCLYVILIPTLASGDCTCDTDLEAKQSDTTEAFHYKIGSIASVLVAGALGVSLPLLSKRIPTLNPKNDIFFMIKAFAAGVILATGFIHILPEAFERLNSPCLKENPWGKFPFAGFVSMLSSIGTLMLDSFATGFYQRQHFSSPSKQVPAADDEEMGDDHVGHIHVHTHATHGHAHGSTSSTTPELIRQRIISQVRSMSC